MTLALMKITSTCPSPDKQSSCSSHAPLGLGTRNLTMSSQHFAFFALFWRITYRERRAMGRSHACRSDLSREGRPILRLSSRLRTHSGVAK